MYASPASFNRLVAYAAYEEALTELSNGFNAAFSKFRTEVAQRTRSCSCLLSSSMVASQSDPNQKTTADLLETMIANESKFVTRVDYSTKYYFNSRTPPFGTASATIKLAADGTLTEATSSVDASKLADMIPLKEFLVDKLGLKEPTPPVPIAPVAKGAPPVKTPRLTLTIATNGYHYRFVEFHELSTGLNHPPITFGGSHNVVRSKFGESAKKAESKNAIEFSGAVTLPEKK